jgi:Na+/phosphate symporter
MKEEKELLKTLHDMTDVIEECISSLQTAFIYNNLSPLTDVHEKCDALKKEIPTLTEQIVSSSRDNPHIRHYVPIPTHIAMMADSTERLSELISKRIKEDILFSDRAISEITFLLQRLIDIVRPASDIILAPNSILGNYIRESEAGIVRRANDYATQHEERLIEGLCLPAASALYINILDSIKNIAWHCKEIANKLAP